MTETADTPFSYKWLLRWANANFESDTKNGCQKIAQEDHYKLVGSARGFFEIEPREKYKYHYKFHLFPQRSQVEQTWDAIVPILMREGIDAKVASPEVADEFADPEHPQCGKTIAIYADWVDDPLKRDWKSILTEIAQTLKKAGIKPGAPPHDKAIIRVNGKDHFDSLIAYRDERQARPHEQAAPPRYTPLQAHSDDDPFTEMVIDLDSSPRKERVEAYAQQRRQRQAFKTSPLSKEEITELVCFGSKRVECSADDDGRVDATLKKWGMSNVDYVSIARSGRWVFFFTDAGWNKISAHLREKQRSL